MSLTRTKVTRVVSAAAAVTRRTVSAARANRRRVRVMMMSGCCGRGIMAAKFAQDCLQDCLMVHARAGAGVLGRARDRHASGLFLAYDRWNGYDQVPLSDTPSDWTRASIAKRL